MIQSIEELKSTATSTEGREPVGGLEMRVVRFQVPHPTKPDILCATGYAIKDGQESEESLRRDQCFHDMWDHYQVEAAGGSEAYSRKLDEDYRKRAAEEASR